MAFFTLEKTPPQGLPVVEQGLGCGTCKLDKACTPDFTPAIGSKPLVVHSNTGGHTDPPEHVARVLARAGMDPGDFDYMGATACQAPAATIANANHCRPWLAKRLLANPPTCIIPFGQVAISAVVGWLWGEEAGMGRRWAGLHIPDQQLNAWVCPLMYGDGAIKQVDDLWLATHARAAVKRAQTAKRPWAKPPQWASRVEVIQDPEAAAAAIASVVPSNPALVAFDYEATSLKPENPATRIYSCALAWGRGPYPDRCISYPWVGPAIAATSALLQHPVPKAAAGAKFEERWTLRKLGHPVAGWYWCTQLGAHWENPQPDTKGLKFQAYASLGYPIYNEGIKPYLEAANSNELNRIHLLPLAGVLHYGGLDSFLEYVLAWKQMKQNQYPLPVAVGLTPTY